MLTNKAEAEIDMANKANAQWGFLKNVININTFFGTGSSSDISDPKVKTSVDKLMKKLDNNDSSRSLKKALRKEEDKAERK